MTTRGQGRPRLITVVMPVRNCEAHIADQLRALANQAYPDPWEMVVVDNGCTDSSTAVVERFRDRLTALRVVSEPRRGLGRARNAGALAARGDLLAYCDADDVAAPGWLEALAGAAQSSDIVGGSNDFLALNGEHRWAWKPIKPMRALNRDYGFLPYAAGGNCAIWTDVARAVQWDERFKFGATDIEFAWRAQLRGYRIAFEPTALMAVRFPPTPALIGHQHFRYGMAEPQLYRRFRAHGMPRSSTRGAFGVWASLAAGAVLQLRAIETRGAWYRRAGNSLGRIYGSARWRALYL